MDAGDLALFDTILCEGGITAAAAKLGQPKTTVSRRLRMLEQAVGAQLFERTGRRLRLTRIGEAFATPARDVRMALAAAQALVQAQTGDDQGSLRMASPVLFGQRVLVPFLATFLAARPQATATLTFEQTAIDPLRRNIDLAFSVTRPEAPYLIVQKLADFDIALYGAPALAARVRTPDDLPAMPVILTGNAEAPEVTWTLAAGPQTHRVTAKVRATVNDPDAAATLLAQGLGIGGLPAFVAQDHVASGRLTPILPGMTVGKVAIYVCAPPLRTQIPIVRSFLQDLRREIRATAFLGTGQAG